MSRLTLEDVSKRYGDVVGLAPIDLEIDQGEFLTLLGPSGCGKTTTLRLIAGFLRPTTGHILFDGEDVTDLPPQRREIGMVFQNYALFPHLTIEDNVGFGLQERGHSRTEIKARVRELLELIRLPAVEGRFPAELSGGQQQRVALARAVAYPPRILLMDEPLGALDLKLREAMQVELRRIQQELGITTVYVTHDQGEAMSLSDRIAVMHDGRIEQLGTGVDIYNYPRTKFVADFIGRINLIPARILDREGAGVWVEVAGNRVHVSEAQTETEGETTLAIRPERITLLSNGMDASELNVLRGTVDAQVYLGNLVTVDVKISEGLVMKVEVRPDEYHFRPGERVRVAWQPSGCTLLRDA